MRPTIVEIVAFVVLVLAATNHTVQNWPSIRCWAEGGALIDDVCEPRGWGRRP